MNYSLISSASCQEVVSIKDHLPEHCQVTKGTLITEELSATTVLPVTHETRSKNAVKTKGGNLNAALGVTNHSQTF